MPKQRIITINNSYLSRLEPFPTVKYLQFYTAEGRILKYYNHGFFEFARAIKPVTIEIRYYRSKYA